MKKLALLALMASTSLSFAQFWSQPWANGYGALESRIYSCRNPVNSGRIALDDFNYGSTFTFSRINWWGTVSNVLAPQPIGKPFYIAIYPNSPHALCQPDLSAPLWEMCVSVVGDLAGIDCQGERVYKFSLNTVATTLPAGLYWIQVSENDASSVRPGVIDFRWSLSYPDVCQARQIDYKGGIHMPLLDPCSQRDAGMAFEILP